MPYESQSHLVCDTDSPRCIFVALFGIVGSKWNPPSSHDVININININIINVREMKADSTAILMRKEP